MSNNIKTGVIGMGKMGVLHTGILNSLQGVEVKALVDNQDIILNFIQGAIPSIKTYKDYKEYAKERRFGSGIYYHADIASH